MQHSKNADMQVATAHWQYMTLRRLNRTEEAKKVLEPITATMDVFENASYHKLLLMYKGETAADALPDGRKPPDSMAQRSATVSRTGTCTTGAGRKL